MPKQKQQFSMFTKVLMASMLSYTIVGLDFSLFSNILANNQTLSPLAAMSLATPLFFTLAAISIYIVIRAFKIGDNRLALLYSMFWPLLLFLLPFVLFSTLLLVLMVACIIIFYELMFVHIHREPRVEQDSVQYPNSRGIHSRAIHSKIHS